MVEEWDEGFSKKWLVWVEENEEIQGEDGMEWWAAGGGTGMMKELRTKIGDGAGDRRGERLDSFIKSLGQSPSHLLAYLPTSQSIHSSYVARGKEQSWRLL